MKSILIVQTGTTFPSLKRLKGDFDEWVARSFGRACEYDVQVARVCDGDSLPSPTDVAGVVVTGSPAMVTDHAPWSEQTAEWLAQAVRREVPTLGICYGHQLLAYALGGRVGDNPNGPELGTVIVTPNACGAQDPLLGDFQGPFKAHMCHRQSVLDLPKCAVVLASTRKEPCAAFSFSDCAWGVQFHPEFDSRILKVYVLHHKDELQARGVPVRDVFASCMETGCGPEILRRFLWVVRKRDQFAGRRVFASAV